MFGEQRAGPTGNRARLCLILLAAWLAVAALVGTATGSRAAQSARPEVGWQLQSPIPTRYNLNAVDMVSATEGWAGGAQATMLHTTDGGFTWSSQAVPIAAGEPIYSIRFLDALHGIAGSTNTVLYTTNGGVTWQAGSGVVGSIYMVEMADPTHGFASYGGNSIYKSSDGGRTWQSQAMPANVGQVQFFEPNNGVAASPNGTFHSSNGGASWTLVAGPYSGQFINPNQGWSISGNTAARTTDGGSTWQPLTLPASAWIYAFKFVDALNGWAVGGAGEIYHTGDGGTSWTRQFGQPNFIAPLQSVDFTDPLHGITVGTDGEIFGTTDGTIWTRRFNGSPAEALSLARTDADHIWASGPFGKVLYTTDGGSDWRLARVPNTSAVLRGIDFADQLNGWTGGEAGTGGVLFHTTDGGVTWQQQTEPTGQRIFSVEALSPQTIMVAGGGTYFTIARRSTDAGASWTTMPVPLNDAMFLDIFFVNGTTGWIVGSAGGIARSTDGGLTWAAQSAPSTYGLTTVHFSDANNGWAGGYYGALLHTTDGGQTWVQQNPQLPDFTHVLGIAAISPQVAWIDGYGGGAASRPYVKQTTDGGLTWVNQTPAVGPYDGFASILFLDAENGWAGGAAGIFRRSGAAPPATATPMPVTPGATATRTPGVSATATRTALTTPTPVGPPATLAPTQTVTRVASSTPPATATSPPLPTRTPGGPSATPGPSNTPGPTICPVQFADVPAGSTFYDNIRCLACRGIVGGYPCGGPGEPCPGAYYRPNNNVTRGQTSKIVASAAGFADPVPSTQQTFEDIPPGSTFHRYIEQLAGRGVIGGYPCGGPGEPCVGPANRPYFRSNNNVTRGQLAKIVAGAAQWTETPTGQTFADVLPGSTFYLYVERVAGRGIVAGYPCGGAGEPCVAPGNRPYFRLGSNATRGQISKIAAQAFFPNCTPAARP